MYLVINDVCSAHPPDTKPLVSEGTALLNMLKCLGYEAANPPLADLLRRHEQLDGEWLILSPVYWQATHNDASIVAVDQELGLDAAQARFCFNLFAEHLALEDISLHYYDATTWLLYDPQKRPLHAKPVYHVLHKSLLPELQQLDATLFWQKFITESQMLLAAQKKPLYVNGVWPWGNAPLAEKKKVRICADAAFFSLAQQCSVEVTLYDPALKIKDYQIILISSYSVLSDVHQEELKKISSDWYWNNTAYTSSTSNWCLRLWRKLIHAD